MLPTFLLACVIPMFPALLAAGPYPSQDTGNAPTSERVAAYAEAAMGRRVGRGECWDLAQYALNDAGARWDGFYGFGTPVDTSHQVVQRGDVVQFEGVVVERFTATSQEQETMGHHTAIVLSIQGPGRYALAHQNFGKAGRRVSRYLLVMADVKKGAVTFFRPVDRAS